MLTKFEVENFKGFEKNLTFDLTNTKQYGFNQDCISNDVIKKALIYGHNGEGKSNLAYAIFDIIWNITDKESQSINYESSYLNAYADPESQRWADFSYEFRFESGIVQYKYKKRGHSELICETLTINGNGFASFSRFDRNTIANINAKGAETLNKDMGRSGISLIKYIKSNAVLEETLDNKCFYDFVKFVEGMLYFRSLKQNMYIGFETGQAHIGQDIIEKGNVEDLEVFLNKAGIKCKLGTVKQNADEELCFTFKNKKMPFFDIASTGTQSLVLFYYWLQRLRKSSTVTFLFIDEFDAYYHHELSALIIDELKKIDAQAILTTHNTSIITNNLLRPDCYFLLKGGEIRSLASKTEKELRKAHNIEKMYRAGVFNE